MTPRKVMFLLLTRLLQRKEFISLLIRNISLISALVFCVCLRRLPPPTPYSGLPPSFLLTLPGARLKKGRRECSSGEKREERKRFYISLFSNLSELTYNAPFWESFPFLGVSKNRAPAVCLKRRRFLLPRPNGKGEVGKSFFFSEKARVVLRRNFNHSGVASSEEEKRNVFSPSRRISS